MRFDDPMPIDVDRVRRQDDHPQVVVAVVVVGSEATTTDRVIELTGQATGFRSKEDTRIRNVSQLQQDRPHTGQPTATAAIKRYIVY